MWAGIETIDIEKLKWYTINSVSITINS
jgi:hypothetical protein